MAATRLAVELLAMIQRPTYAVITKTLEGYVYHRGSARLSIALFGSLDDTFFFFRVETQVFKSKFDAWDDVLAVDFTRTAENVSKKGADMKVRKC